MSAYFIPVLFLIILIVSIVKKVKPYDAFTFGAKSALPFAVNVFPYLASIFVMTELFEVSGLSNLFCSFLSPVMNLVGIPTELTKLVLIKPFSGSGSLALLSELFTYITRVSTCQVHLGNAVLNIFCCCKISGLYSFFQYRGSN